MGKTIRDRKSDASKKAILDAALRVIARRGYSAATMEEIVKEAGVSKGLVYYHFKSKADMASAILKRGVDGLVDMFDAIAQDSDSAREALISMLDAFSKVVVGNREFGRFFLSELWRSGRVWSTDMQTSENRLISVISEQFERGKREGIVAQDEDGDFDAVACIGLVLTTSLYYFGDESDGKQISESEFSDLIREFVGHATAASAHMTRIA